MIRTFKHIVIQSLLSLIIIVSGMSFSIHKHVCLKNTNEISESVYPKCCQQETTQSCHAEQESSCCSSKESIDFGVTVDVIKHCDIGCCIDVVNHIQGIKIEQQAQEKLSLKVPVVQKEIPFFVYNFPIYFADIKNVFNHSIHFSPTFSRQILFRVFRI